jgi:osmotically-inducible protein OsmY
MDGGEVPDASLEAVIRRELRADPLLANESVGVDSTNGVINLQGSVASQLARSRVLEIAHVVRGVRAVVDRIEVVPRPRPDYELDFAAASALASDPVTAGTHVTGRAHLGVLYLSGAVGSEGERRVAEADVMALPGVRGVVNDVVVRPSNERERPLDDDRAGVTAARLLRDDVWLDSSHLRVTARDGTVHLSGWVGSAEEWSRAQADARTASPSGAADAGDLRIDRWIDDGTLRRRPAVARSDGDLGQALLDAYVRDPRVHPFVPTVDVHGAVVILTGVAPNPDAARAADEDARDLPGAAAVRDYVKTAPSLQSQSDASVREQVQSALLTDPRLGTLGLVVDVVGGRVYLRGAVATEAERANAIAIAASAPGARDVSDGLVVEPPRLPRAGVTSPQAQ